MSKRFRYDALQDRKTILAYLERLTEGFRQGRIEVSHKGESIVLAPQGLINFIFEARADENGRKLAIKLHWKERAEGEGESEAPLVLKAGGKAE